MRLYRYFFVFLLLITENSFSQTPIKTINQLRIQDSLVALSLKPQHGYPQLYSKKMLPAFPSSQYKTAKANKKIQNNYNNQNLQGPIICYDTAGKYFINNDSIIFYTENITKLKNNSYLVSGLAHIKKPTGNQDAQVGYIMKANDTGKISWLKTYDSAGHKDYSYFTFYKIKELENGNFFAIGASENRITGNDDIVLMLTDSNGEIIWTKFYKCTFWTSGSGSADYIYVRSIMQESGTNFVYFDAGFWNNGRGIVKVDAATGDIIWSKSYNLAGYAPFDRPGGMQIQNDEIYYWGQYLGYNDAVSSFHRINKNTGAFISTKAFAVADKDSFKIAILRLEQVVKLNNGNYILAGTPYGYYIFNNVTNEPLFQSTIIEVDSSFNFIKGYTIRSSIESNFYNNRTTVYPDGSAYFSMIKIYSGYTADYFSCQLQNGQIINERKKFTQLGLPIEPNSFKTTDGSDVIIRLVGDSAVNHAKIEFTKLHPSDTPSGCLGFRSNSFIIQPFGVKPMNSYLYQTTDNIIVPSNQKTITLRNDTAKQMPVCSQVSYCDSLSIRPYQTTICLSDTLNIRVFKNTACGSTPYFTLDTATINYFKWKNDSTVSINFKQNGTFQVSATLKSCFPLTDSFKITVLKTNSRVNLGKDTVICENNSIVLKAGKGYKTYLWQNGSSDSVLVVTQPGAYSVRVTDSCDNISIDSILVNAYPHIAFELGSPITICQYDSATITAPPGFISYQWSPSYKINTLTGQTVKVAPLLDTFYTVRAEKIKGCFVSDSILIRVKSNPLIYLGNDTSFCNKDSLLLNAGSGFSEYLWSTGERSAAITVKDKGTYYVFGKTSDGCKAYDTITIRNVYDLPVFDIGSDPVLCEDKSRILDAGINGTYKWNTGAITKTISINNTGLYKVSVTDFNGCKNSDSILINQFINKPSGFLPNDTVICNYSKLTLTTNKNFEYYNWSTGVQSKSITINKSGTFSLHVADQFGCSGSDTITIATKDCLKGFFIPNAFTPAKNLNKIFKPLIFGVIETYEFKVYNRFGQLIFKTTNTSEGWNGTINGIKQDPGTYIWTCSFKLEDEPAETRKGSVLLLR